MLNLLNLNDWDIVTIQEPHIDFKGVTHATHPWQVVYPSQHYQATGDTRSLLLINKNLATNHWELLPIDFSDVTVIHLMREFREVRILNVYNDCTHSRTLDCLEQLLLTLSAITPNYSIPKYDIWLGDFNRDDLL